MQCRVVLGDFGEARRLQEGGEAFSLHGTRGFLSPEMLNAAHAEGHGPPTDMWSLGATLLMLSTGASIDEGIKDGEEALKTSAWSFEALLSALPAPKRQLWDAQPAWLRDLVRRCLRCDAAQRCTARQMLPYFRPVFEQWGGYRVLVSPALGGGLTAQVYLGESGGGTPFALKRFGTGRVGLGEEALKVLKASASAELGIMRGLSHPNIVRLHGEVDVGADICLVLDYAPGASAKARMRAPMGKAALMYIDQLAWLAHDIAQALVYLHGDPLGTGGAVVHRDIKPGNIVFTAVGWRSSRTLAQRRCCRTLSKSPRPAPWARRHSLPQKCTWVSPRPRRAMCGCLAQRC